MTNRAFPALLVVLAACDTNQTEWIDFNAADQTLVVEVTEEGSEPGEALELELLSNVGGVSIGTATLDPGSGPVGTQHFLLVEVLEDYAESVGRASVVIVSEAVADLDGDGDEDSRGEAEFDLERDAAEPGVFALTLQSQGTAGEVRQDELTIHLWTQDLEGN